VFRNRRFACLFLGLWLGAAIAIDVLVLQNSATADRFISSPPGAAVSAQIRESGAGSVRSLLHRNADEENARILEVWEWSQIGIALILFFMILFGDRPPVSALVLVAAMLVIVLVQRVVLSPNMVSLGREVVEIPAMELTNNPIVTRASAFRAFYAGFEIVKLLLALGVGARLMYRRIPDKTTREYGRAETGSESGRPSDRRVRKRRTTDHRNTEQNG
jgi:hypothetical protein